jgi:molybdopterin/thiamine biosynthesis adenylyltransferase
MNLFQVGAGSGGIAVLDLVARDPRVTRVALVEPDVYAPHNVYRHLFPHTAVGRLKAELAAEWLRAIRPDLAVEALVADITDPARQAEFAGLAAECDVGVCAADTESAKFAFDALMRAAGKPWVLGEVLSGGIGGWVHRFAPGGACYGCLATFLQREVTEAPPAPPPDYSAPGAAREEARIPASKASIAAIAALHALAVLEGAERAEPAAPDFPPCDSLLFALRAVPGVFAAAHKAHPFRVPRAPQCLTCGAPAPPHTGAALDAALDDALARLGAR